MTTKLAITRNVDGSYGLKNAKSGAALGLKGDGGFTNNGSAAEKALRINPLSGDLAKISPTMAFGRSGSMVGNYIEVHFKNNTGKFLERGEVTDKEGYELKEAPEILQPGQMATIVVNGGFMRGPEGVIVYNEKDAAGNVRKQYGIKYNVPFMGKNTYDLWNDARGADDIAAPMYFASTRGNGVDFLRTQVAGGAGYSSNKFNSDTAGAGRVPPSS